ncbi:hypothetical protein TNCV_3810751 [Trichonephila clavipes]|nr:hypothetical protein TNCV_3810751 [Trichonephila clavipes]
MNDLSGSLFLPTETGRVDNVELRCQRAGASQVYLFSFNWSGRSSLVVKVTDSRPACHEFMPSTAEDPSCRAGGRCMLNLSMLESPPVGVEVGRGVPVQISS